MLCFAVVIQSIVPHRWFISAIYNEKLSICCANNGNSNGNGVLQRHMPICPNESRLVLSTFEIH